jgi:rubrerythrin
MVQLYRCRVCGDPYIGASKPSRCPFCGAYENFIVEAKEYSETFDVQLNELDRKNVETALGLEIGNAEFYFCAAEKSDNEESRQLFKALAKVEAEHASIWKKILKKPKIEIGKSATCSQASADNLRESHEREDKAIAFYRQAAKDSENKRVKMLFAAIVQVEQDHLSLSEARLK